MAASKFYLRIHKQPLFFPLCVHLQALAQSGICAGVPGGFRKHTFIKMRTGHTYLRQGLSAQMHFAPIKDAQIHLKKGFPSLSLSLSLSLSHTHTHTHTHTRKLCRMSIPARPDLYPYPGTWPPASALDQFQNQRIAASRQSDPMPAPGTPIYQPCNPSAAAAKCGLPNL